MVLQVDARYPYQAGPWTCVHAVPGAHDAAHAADEEPHMYHTSRRTGSPAVRLDSKRGPLMLKRRACSALTFRT